MNRPRPRWAPDSVDIERPSAARMYDYYLGGSHNFLADRKLAEEYLRVLPEMPVIARAQRGVLHRAVRFMVESGIDQFLDLGSGMPTTGNVHEIAQTVNPAVRTVYVDVDPVAVAHGRALLRDDEGHTGVVHADLRDPGYVLAQPEVGELLDLSRPIGVLMIAVLHFVADGTTRPAWSGSTGTPRRPGRSWRSRMRRTTTGRRWRRTPRRSTSEPAIRCTTGQAGDRRNCSPATSSSSRASST